MRKTANHPVVQIRKTHLTISVVHGELEEGAVEADEADEGADGDEMGDVEPYFMRDSSGHGGRGQDA